MKKLLLIVIMLFSINVFAQEDFSVYDNTYAGKEFKIQISYEDTSQFTLWIDAMSLDKLHNKGGIKLDYKRYDEFISAINEAKDKYIEWSNVAKENNVSELEKSMSISPKVGGYFFYGDWNFQYIVNPSVYFKIFKKDNIIKHFLVINTGKLQSSSNQFMKVDGFVLVFSSVEEIDNFLETISRQKLNIFFNKPKAKDLFK